MEYKTLEEILYNGVLDDKNNQNESKSSQFVKSLENKEIMIQEAKKASKIATELAESFANKTTKI